MFAEKLETVIYRGADNSRMKDFHDLYTMICTENTLDKEETKSAIYADFSTEERFSSCPFNLTLQRSMLYRSIGPVTARLQQLERLYLTRSNKYSQSSTNGLLEVSLIFEAWGMRRNGTVNVINCEGAEMAG